jgi:uncharacterized repeat protein (TIGR04052 family)
MTIHRTAQLILMLIPFLAAGVAIANSQKANLQPVMLRFAAKVGRQPFTCGTTYTLGKPATAVTANDFRLYVSDIALVDAGGKSIPLTLEQDGKWQYKTVALLDFENKAGACVNGTTEQRDRIIGTVPKGNYTGLRFTLGVPFKLNHADSTVAPSPLNLTGLWWNWQLGYKFMRLDFQKATQNQPNPPTPGHSHQSQSLHGQSNMPGDASGGFPIHLGSTGCAAEPPTQPPTTCRNPNRAIVTLPRFDVDQNVIVADLARLVAKTNLTQNQPKTAPGCMSEPTDRDCQGIMAQLGLPFAGQFAIAQTFFSVD